MRSTQESSFRKRHILTAANLTPPCLWATPTTASNISQMLFKSCCTLIKRAGFEKLMSQKKVNDMWVVHSCRGSLSLSTTDVLAELFPDRLLSKLLSLTIDMKCLISRCLRLLVQESYRSRGKNAQSEFQRRILSVTDIFETKWNYECCATLNSVWKVCVLVVSPAVCSVNGYYMLSHERWHSSSTFLSVQVRQAPVSVGDFPSAFTVS